MALNRLANAALWAAWRGAAWRAFLLLALLLAPQPAGAARDDERVTALVVLREQADLARDFGATRAARQRAVIAALRGQADATQARLRRYLLDAQRGGAVESFTPLWIQNAVLVTARPDVLDALAGWPEVARVTPEQVIEGPPRAAAAGGPVEPNIGRIRAPDLWSLGLRGEGVVVASLDTGVDATHPDLAPRFRGGSHSWYDPYGQHPAGPVDLNGHGTETTGVMVGGEAGGSAIGVAPGSQWIAAKIFNDRNQATTSAIHLAYQWLLDPDGDPATADAPHVVNNSWTFGAPGCDTQFEADLAALGAAGILPVFAAGNFGPGDATDASPANNPAAFAVGAVDDADAVDRDSSRGPTSCGGAPRTFPDAAAPGVRIRTATLFGQYADASGTSLAAPHAAGSLALLLSAYPDLSAAEQRAALLAGAVDLGAAGPDNSTGAGRIDALAAYNSVHAQRPIFADDFETGDLSRWSGAVTGGGALRVAAGAGVGGSAGLTARVDGGQALYVADESPRAEAAYHARFYFSPNGVALPRGPAHRIFAAYDAAGRELLAVEVRAMARRYEARATAGGAGTEWRGLTNAWHALEVGWSAGEGRLEFYVDGAAAGTLTGIAAGDARIEAARLGVVDGAYAAAAGTERFDAFVSTPGWPVGP